MRDDGVVEFKDFAYDPTPKRFRLYRDGDVLEAAPELPLAAMDTAGKLAKQAKTLASDDPKAAIDMMLVFLREILLDDSLDKLMDMVSDRRRPLGAKMMMDIFAWLMEEYGMRPTQPSPDSSSSSPDDGSITLTAGPSVEVSTSGNFALTDSSMSSTPTSMSEVPSS